MDSQVFVTAVERHVLDAAINDTISNLRSPPGRRVQQEVKERSDWYNALSATEVAHVDRMIALAAHAAIFGLLAALDGARTIDDGTGRFELAYVGRGSRVLLNAGSTDLHDLLSPP